MRIAALTVNGMGGWPDIELTPVMLGLNVVYGPAGTGKTTTAGFLAHVLYGLPPAPTMVDAPRAVPDGEAIIHSGESSYRLRRSKSNDGVRLTVSSLDGTAVDSSTVRRMMGGLSPFLLRRLCVINFREPPQIEWLLSAQFAREFGSLGVHSPTESSRRTVELLARRDTLAKELETRLAGEGRASRDLDARRRELDRQIAESERELNTTEQRFRAVEAALTETDTRLRYRRLELNADRAWWGTPPVDWEAQLVELDGQIVRWRTALAELASREATVQARLAQVQPSIGAAAANVVDEQAWLSVARQLAADLSGEVARLARASSSEQCVCRDAHPRLRPIVDTLQRQLDVLATVVTERQQELTAAELKTEAGHLARSQAELGRQLEHLLERRQTVARGAQPGRRVMSAEATTATESGSWLTAADAEQLERRRIELEEQRYELTQRLSAQDRALRDLRAQRATVDRQRAALLSARSIEHVQRELAVVQQKLQESMQAEAAGGVTSLAAENSPRASDILAKLTGGRLVRLQLVDQGRSAHVWRVDGTVVGLDALSPTERDQVYLSFGLALASAVTRQGVELPLLLNEPFLRLDAEGMAALAAVLDDLGRHGQQIIVFTSQREAAHRMASLGAPVSDIQDLRQREGQRIVGGEATAPVATSVRPVAKKVKRVRRPLSGEQGKTRRVKATDDSKNGADKSDAA